MSDIAIPDENLAIAERLVPGMRQRLLSIMEAIPSMSTSDAAALWRGIDIIARDLAAVKRDASNQMVAVAPIETYKYRGETRSRPVKQQIVPGVGVVMIENTATREWANRRELAHEMAQVWSFAQAADNDGNMPAAKDLVDFIFDVFSVGDPKTTVMKEKGLGEFDEEPWVKKDYEKKARVL